MDNLILELTEFLKSKGFKNVESYINLEGDEVASFESGGEKYLLKIDVL